MKKNERGYTLIELIIAIAILAIIAIPLMHGFVTAAKTNAKAREIEQATTVGQNTMEEIKATPIEDLIKDVVPDSAEITLGNGDTVEMLSYKIVHEDVVTDGVPYRVDVRIENEPGGGDGDPRLTDYNQSELAQLYDMNAAYDAFFILEEATDDALIGELAVAAGASVSEVRSRVQRNIYVDIKEETGTRLVEVNVSYKYKHQDVNITRHMAAQNQCIYASSSRDTYLRNVYVFFEPLSNMEEGDAPKETITVRNTCCAGDKKPVQIYLVKQGTEQDDNYAVAVNLMEQSRDLASYKDADGNIRVMTAVCTNLSFPKDTSDTAKDEIVLKYSTRDGGYQGSMAIDGNSYTAEELAGLTTLAAEAKQDWVYNVYVEVRRKDADEDEDALVFLKGTKEK